MTANIQNWQYKHRSEIEALSNEVLVKLYHDLTDAITTFHKYKVPMSDEMFWQLVVSTEEINRRGIVIDKKNI